MNVKTFYESVKGVNEAIQVGGPIVKPNLLPSSVESTLNSRLGDEYAAYYFYRNAAGAKTSTTKKPQSSLKVKLLVNFLTRRGFKTI